MKQCCSWPIGVCTWSMQNDFDRLDALMKTTGIEHVHLDLRPVCIDRSESYLPEIRKRQWTISAAMIGFPQEDYTTLETIRTTGGIVPDNCWPENQHYFLRAIETAAELGVACLTAHVGFIDHENAAGYGKLLERMQLLADAAARQRVTLLMETGQETAQELMQFLADLNHPAVGVNFDPANIILYSKGDPVEAARLLRLWIGHVHIKDAIPASTVGQWGREVVWGTGTVNTKAFLSVLNEIGYTGTLAVEREAGQTRDDDIRVAIDRLTQFQ